jgi:hypothetical protein
MMDCAATDGKKYPVPEEWLAHRPTIKRLYQDEDRTLKEVMEIMKKEHNFFATQVDVPSCWVASPWGSWRGSALILATAKKMYNKRFKDWGVGKNLRADEVLTMLHAKK